MRATGREYEYRYRETYTICACAYFRRVGWSDHGWRAWRMHDAMKSFLTQQTDPRSDHTCHAVSQLSDSVTERIDVLAMSCVNQADFVTVSRVCSFFDGRDASLRIGPDRASQRSRRHGPWMLVPRVPPVGSSPLLYTSIAEIALCKQALEHPQPATPRPRTCTCTPLSYESQPILPQIC